MNIEDLSKAIARGIMTCGDEPESPSTRLQFMSGQWPEQEKAQGGLSEEALARLVESLLRRNTKAVTVIITE